MHFIVIIEPVYITSYESVSKPSAVSSGPLRSTIQVLYLCVVCLHLEAVQFVACSSPLEFSVYLTVLS